MRPRQALYDRRSCGRLLDGQRLALASGRHERQNDEIGVRVEEDVFDERI